MIGFFDSGVGGFNSLFALRKALPFADMIYLADRKNAPYGTKTEDEVLSLANKNIKRLSEMGAKKILIACCTASTLWDKLPREQKMISMPIILPAVNCLDNNNKRIMVIATERTVSSKFFSRAIFVRFPEAYVVEVAMQSLVSAVEEGIKNRNLFSSTLGDIKRLVCLFEEYRPDTLVLGCTHFSSVEHIIHKALPDVNIINPAYIGAMEMIKCIADCGINTRESGRLIYT